MLDKLKLTKLNWPVFWTLTPRQFLALLIGVILYFFASHTAIYWLDWNCFFSPEFLVSLFFGAQFGPLVGLAVGALGSCLNALVDSHITVGWWVAWSPYSDRTYDFHTISSVYIVGYALIGFIAGWGQLWIKESRFIGGSIPLVISYSIFGLFMGNLVNTYFAHYPLANELSYVITPNVPIVIIVLPCILLLYQVMSNKNRRGRLVRPVRKKDYHRTFLDRKFSSRDIDELVDLFRTQCQDVVIKADNEPVDSIGQLVQAQSEVHSITIEGYRPTDEAMRLLELEILPNSVSFKIPGESQKNLALVTAKIANFIEKRVDRPRTAFRMGKNLLGVIFTELVRDIFYLPSSPHPVVYNFLLIILMWLYTCFSFTIWPLQADATLALSDAPFKARKRRWSIRFATLCLIFLFLAPFGMLFLMLRR